jgi:hypothetical protein
MEPVQGEAGQVQKGGVGTMADCKNLGAACRWEVRLERFAYRLEVSESLHQTHRMQA